MNQKPPNILLIMADQLSPQFTGAYGHPIVKTPNIDKLAKLGARFDSAYCNSPLCAPSRFAMMSGQLISRIAAYDNASEFPACIPTFAHYLKLMGYRTCLSGKMHFIGPDQLHGFEERITTDIYPCDYAWTPDWEQADERIDKWYHNMNAVFEAGVAASTFQIDFDEEVAFHAKRKLMDYARDETAPFCMVASFIHPHDPYVALKKWWDLYEEVEIDLPATKLDRENQDAFSQRLMDGIEASKYTPSEEQIKTARRAYYANTSYFDSKVGELIETLKETNQYDNTIIVITADHGDMLGERGLWYKMNFFEHASRVPLIMSGPGIIINQVSNACSLVDLLPTVLDIAATTGLEKPDLGQAIDGRSLMPLASGQADDSDEAIGEYCAEMTDSPVLMIRRRQYKFIYCETDQPMLFDLQNDVHETTNLALDADYAELTQIFLNEVTQRWDSKILRENVLLTQRQRRTVHSAMLQGQRTDWDYKPPFNPSEVYVRNHMDWTEAAGRKRYPRKKDHTHAT